nr:MAG TPA: hypothetical protein [Caudoviricetes sp.]
MYSFVPFIKLKLLIILPPVFINLSANILINFDKSNN